MVIGSVCSALSASGLRGAFYPIGQILTAGIQHPIISRIRTRNRGALAIVPKDEVERILPLRIGIAIQVLDIVNVNPKQSIPSFNTLNDFVIDPGLSAVWDPINTTVTEVFVS